jgi:hypothetical protein
MSERASVQSFSVLQSWSGPCNQPPPPPPPRPPPFSPFLIRPSSSTCWSGVTSRSRWTTTTSWTTSRRSVHSTGACIQVPPPLHGPGLFFSYTWNLIPKLHRSTGCPQVQYNTYRAGEGEDGGVGGYMGAWLGQSRGHWVPKYELCRCIGVFVPPFALPRVVVSPARFACVGVTRTAAWLECLCACTSACDCVLPGTWMRCTS